MQTEPQATWRKFNQNRAGLYQEVTDRLSKALKYEKQLQEKDLPPGGLRELVNNFVAPLDIPISENQLSPDKEEQILDWATDPPEAAQ
jgi:hypothetical protein